MPRLLEHLAAGWEVVSLDIVSKFEPAILCDIRSWDYTTFPGHFDMVWASPVCTEYSRALTTRPRLLEGDALVLSALEIIAHFDPLMWVIENPATGLLKTRPFMERLPWVDVTYCKYGTPYRKQTRLWTNMRWRPRRSLCRPGSRCEAWQDGRHLRAAQRGPRLMEGQYERVSQSRELLYSVPAALCEEIAHTATGGANQKWRRGAPPAFAFEKQSGTGPFFVVFVAHSKAVSRCIKNEAEGHRALVKHRDARAGERHHQMNEQASCRARSPERVLTPLSGILGTRSVGKPAMKLWPTRPMSMLRAVSS